jgi:hypothetical protein
MSVFGMMATAAHAGTLISFALPPNGYVASTGGNFTATLLLTESANPATLQVTLGSEDVTKLFQSNCSKAPCSITVTLGTNSGVLPGQNYLVAKIRGANYSVDQARLRFIYHSGLQDPTTGPSLSHFVPVLQSGTSITVMTPTPQLVEACPSPQIKVAVFDRTNLNLQADKTSCLPADATIVSVLSTFDQSDLIIVNAAWGSGTADFSSMGGNSSQVNKIGYYAVGFGSGTAGTAFEAWQETSDDGSHPKTVGGVLTNVGCSSGIAACTQNEGLPVYIFQPTDSMGFAIISGATGSSGAPGLPTIYVGNPKTMPLNSNDPPPNQEVPINSGIQKTLFDYQAYTPQWTGGNAAGGMFLVTLNRSDLTLYSQALYVTNCNCADHRSDNSQILQLATALGDSNPNRLFLLTTVGSPFNADSAMLPLLGAVAALGTPAASLQATIPDYLGTPPGLGFSMLGYPGTITGTQSGGSSVMGQVTNNVSDTGPLKLYSSSANIQQNETGALRGVFTKRHSSYYEADNVSSFTQATLPVYATGDDNLAFALSSVLGTTEPVSWPQMDTVTKRNAYAYLSNKLLSTNFIDGSCGSYCGDIRYYYTTTDASTIYNPLQPFAVPYPGDEVAQASGFSSTDFIAVQAQLQLEATYLKTVLAYEGSTELLNTNDDINVGSAMRSAGATVTNDLEVTLGTSAPAVSATPIKIAQDTLATASSFFAIVPGVDPLTLLSGLLGTTANILGFVQDMKVQRPQPDPYVTQLSQLTQQDTNNTESEISRYSDDILTASNIFYNGVYSDWFRLQSVALLAADQGYGGWFLEDAPTDRSDYLKSLSINERVKLYQQIVPQYFSQVAYTGVATGFQQTSNKTSTTQTFSNFLSRYGGPQAHTTSLSNLNEYSWDVRTSPSSNYCQDYYIIFLQNRWNTTWPSSFGDMLFGNQTASDGVTSDLNLDRNFFLDRFSIPWWTSGVSYPQPVNGQTKGSDNESWACGDHGPYAKPSPTTFSKLTPSQTIPPGKTIFVQGVILGASGQVPTGNVQVEIGTAQSIVSIADNGQFSANVDTSQLQATPYPYTITYSWEGVVAQPDGSTIFTSAYDISTTLTINSPNTETELSAPSGNVITYPQAEQLNVTVKSPAGVPTGSVTFYSDGLSLGQSAVVASGTFATAPFSATALAGGVHTLSAQFVGTGLYQNSSSDQVYVTVNRMGVTMPPTSLLPREISFGTSNILIVGTIASNDGKPLPDGEQMTVTVAGIQQPTTITGGKGQFSLSFATGSLTPGVYTIQYGFPGNINLLPLSDSSQLMVDKVTATEENITPSQPITAGTASFLLTGAWSGVPNFIPTGNVTATIDGQTSSPAKLQNGSFTLSFQTGSIPPSTSPYKVTYQYSGDLNYLASVYDSTTLTVNANETITILNSSSSSANYGTNVTFTAAVQPIPSIAPVGTVTFYDGTTSLGDGVALVNGVAALNVSSLGIGVHSIKAVYGASTFYSPSTSNTVGFSVDALTTSLYDSTSPAPVSYGNAVIYLSAQIAGKSGGTVVDYPAGQTLTITIGDISQKVTLQKFGVFGTSFPMMNFPVGTHPIKLDYAGDSRFASMSDSSLQLTVSKGSPVFNHLTLDPLIVSGVSSIGLSGAIAARASTGGILQFGASNNADLGGVVLPYDVTGVSTDSATYSVWINTSVKTQQMLIQLAYEHPYIYMQNDQLGVLWDGAGDGWLSTDTTPISDGLWHHIAVTFTNGKIAFYKDGIATSDSFAVTSVGSASTPVNLGGSYSGIPSFVGQMWNAKMWSKPLALADVQEDMLSVYGGNLPDGLKFMSAFDQGNNTVSNVVNSATIVTPVNPATDPQITTNPLPSPYPPAAEQILVTVGGQDTPLTIGANGTFAGKAETSGLGAGSYSVLYKFSGDSNFISATDSSTTLKVQPALTTISVTSSNQSASYGSEVTFTGTVTPSAGSGTPQGSVAFYDGNVALSPVEPLNAGLAKFPTSSLAVGTHSITAVYQGSTDYGTSTSAPFTQVVATDSTNTAITSSGNPADYGSTIKFTVIVTSSGTTPDGTVTILDGNTPLTKPILLTSGVASITVSTLESGSHSLTASYSGSANFSGSTGALTQVVNYLVPDFATLAYPQPIYAGTSSVTLGGTIGAGNIYPVGATVSITVNDVAAYPPAVVQNDGTFSASVDTHNLGLGSYAVTYKFATTGNFKGISDNSTRLVVQPAATFTKVTSSTQETSYGSPVVITASVSNVDSSSTPSGSVAFFDGGNQLGSTVVLSGGQAVFQIGTLDVGSHSITAKYASDTTNYTDSTSSVLTETINLQSSVFSNLSPSQSLTRSSSGVTLAGTIASSSFASGSVVQYSDALNDSSGGAVFPYDITGVSTDAATYSMWINTSAKTQQMLFEVAYEHPYIYMQNDQIGVLWDGAGSGWLSTDTRSISDGHWHHIAVTFSQGKITFYKDGVATGDTFSVISQAAASSPVNLGGSYSNIPRFVGQLWNAKIWADSLSSDAISTDMYQTYSSGTIPSDLRMLAAFDAGASTAKNLVNGDAASNISGTFAWATLPAHYYPGASEQVSLTIGSQTPTYVNVGPNGSFAATVPVNNLSTGIYPIEYGYKGNVYLAPITDDSKTLTVQDTVTTTTVTSSAPIVDYRTSVTFTATVTSQNGTPAGTVAFLDGNNLLGSAVTLSSGNAKFQTASLLSGAHSITATYVSSGSGFAGSTSLPITQTIDKQSPVFSNLAAHVIKLGVASVTLNGKIAAGTVIPASNVVFIAIAIPSNTLTAYATIGNDGSFSQTFDTLAVAAGQYKVRYKYSESTNFNEVEDDSTTLTVQIPTTTTLTSSSPKVALGSSVMFTATVSAQSATPTGTVQFLDGGKMLSSIPLSAGKAIYTTDALAGGSHTITATYSNMTDPNAASFATSASSPITQMITAVAPVVGLSANPNPADQSEPITLSATVQQMGGIVVTGSMDFREVSIGSPSYISYGTVPIVNGQATFQLDSGTNSPSLAPGMHNVYAVYSGDGGVDYNAATSPYYELTVNSLSSSEGNLSLVFPSGTSNSVTVAQGQPASFPLTVKPLSGYTGGAAITCTPEQPVTNVFCSVSPSLLSVANGSKTVTVTITTVNGTASEVRIASCLISGLVFALLAFRRKWRILALPVFAIIASLGAGGCGGHASHVQYAKPGTYKFNISASTTSGSASTATITATVIVKGK